MMALLLEPLQFTFMSHALLISLVVSIPCALLSVFLVLKGWALMGDAMSHAVFPGIVLAWILGLPLATGAFIAGVFCAVATGYLKDNSRIKQDTVMGIVFSGMFAAGLILYIAVKPDIHLDHILFGDMLGVTIGDIIQTMIIAGLVTLVISVKWRDFLLFSFDYQQAQVSGLHTRWLHYGLLCMVSLTIVATLKAVGIILSISLLIAPGAIAVLLTQRFHIALLLATGISVIVSMTGVWLSFFIDSAPAPTIVVLFAVVFIMTFTVISFNARTKGNAHRQDLLSPNEHNIRGQHCPLVHCSPESHGRTLGGGANPFIQKICKINNGCKSFNTRTIGSSPASRSTFLHTTCLRFQLHQSTNHDGQCQDSTSKNRKLAVSAEHRPDGG